MDVAVPGECAVKAHHVHPAIKSVGPLMLVGDSIVMGKRTEFGPRRARWSLFALAAFAGVLAYAALR